MRRRIPERDVRRDAALQLRDLESDIEDIRRDRIADRVEWIDRWQKALTGRRAADYARESGIALDQLFPEGKEVLNIGDPWQTLDLDGVTSIDYEFGEEAEFVANEESFLREVPALMNQVTANLSGYEASSEEVVRPEETLAKSIQRTIEAQTAAVLAAVPDDFEALANIFRTLHEQISLLHQAKGLAPGDVREIDTGLREAWYGLVRLERGFRDSHLVRTVIRPALQAQIIRDRLSSEDQQELMRQLIEQHRFEKKTKHARVMKATFPNVPFEPKSFDRIIASWSLSTHMFPEMSQEDFTVYWNKIDELLRQDGVAYLWPIYQGNNDVLVNSLVAYARTGGRAEMILSAGPDERSTIVSIDDPHSFLDVLENGATLAVYPRK